MNLETIYSQSLEPLTAAGNPLPQNPLPLKRYMYFLYGVLTSSRLRVNIMSNLTDKFKITFKC